MDSQHTHFKHTVVGLALGLFANLAMALPTPAPVRAEIDTLLAKLTSSGCQFDRNGTWYDATEAKSHILRKLDYLEGKTTIQTTEQFIELAASKSSSSGKPYRVKCGGEGAVASQQWLSQQLNGIRANAKSKP